MRTTLDLPEPLFRQLKARAATEGTTIKELLRVAVECQLSTPPQPAKRKRVKFPILDSAKPGTLRLSNRQIDDLLT